MNIIQSPYLFCYHIIYLNNVVSKNCYLLNLIHFVNRAQNYSLVSVLNAQNIRLVKQILKGLLNLLLAHLAYLHSRSAYIK